VSEFDILVTKVGKKIIKILVTKVGEKIIEILVTKVDEKTIEILVTKVGEKGRSASVGTKKKLQCKKKPITVQVIEALTSPEVLGKIILILSDGLLN
jgi:hypothetical protein